MVFSKPSHESSNSGNSVLIGKKFDPYTGKWKDVYGPAQKKKTKSKVAPKKSSGSSKKKPEKPPTPDKKNDDRGSGKDVKSVTQAEVRNMEYDLEGSVQIRPITDITSRTVLNFQGLGYIFSGDYFVSSVTHTINRSGYSQALEVLRSDFKWRLPPKNKHTKGKNKVTPKKPPSKSKYYTVKPGDNLWNIAKRFYGKGTLFTKIYNANKGKIKNPSSIYPGQKLYIP